MIQCDILIEEAEKQKSNGAFINVAAQLRNSGIDAVIGIIRQHDKNYLDAQAVWNEWRGGEPPVAADKPIRVKWPSGYTRTYERGDMIYWPNLQTDGSLKWRKP